MLSIAIPDVDQTPVNPKGLPKKVFDDFQATLAANRSQFYRDVAAGPFYGYNRPGAKSSEAVIENWWPQGMNVTSRPPVSSYAAGGDESCDALWRGFSD